MNNSCKVNADGTVFSCCNNLDLARYAHGSVYETPLEEIVQSEAFLTDKANKLSCDPDVVPRTCRSCEFRAYRSFKEEFLNMRQRIFPNRPVKTFFYRLFGLMFISEFPDSLSLKTRDLRNYG